MPDAGEPNQAVNLPPPRQRPWDDEVSVPLPTDAGFTAAEHWAWSKIIRGEIADMRIATGTDDGAGSDANEEVEGKDGAKTLKPWPASRKLSAKFLDTILFHEPWASAKAKPRTLIRCAWVTDRLDWINAEVKDEFWLDRCRIDVQPDWKGTRFAGLVSLEGARLAEGLIADRLYVGGSLFCRAGFKALAELRLLGARIIGDADFVSATLAEGLAADAIQIEGSLFCQRSFKAEGPMVLRAARIKGVVSFIGAVVEHGVDADGVIIESGLFCQDGFKSDGPIVLRAARINRVVSFIGATLAKGLDADGLQVEGALFCRGGFKAEGVVNLLGARISRNAQLLGEFNDRVNLTGATIAGELQFDQGGESQPTWGQSEKKKARLVLRNVTCGALAGKIDSFKRTNAKNKREFVQTDLLGLSYARIGGLATFGAQAGGTLADAPAKELIALLQSDAPKNGVFKPQPYRQLADALMAAGREEKAHDIRRALLEHERTAKGVPFTRKIALTLSSVLIGHGFASWRAAVMFVGLVIATAGIGLAYEGRPAVTSLAAMDFRAMGDWGGYALGNAIPLLELDPRHQTFVTDRFGETPPLGLKTWLYSFKLLGFLLLSYLAAGLTGFASRSARS